MNEREPLEQLSRDELISLVRGLQAQVRTLQAEIDTLKQQQKRSAAPFSRGTHKPNPKKPGRKKGQGPFSFRRPPKPPELTEPPIDVPVTEPDCPDCGEPLVEERIDVAYVTELPPEIRPSVKQYRISVCRCPKCGKQVRGRHPDLADDQWGATAHRLGPRAQAAGQLLHYQVGIPVRKVPDVLSLLSGIDVTQSALTQAAFRQSEGAVGKAATDLRDGVKRSPVVNTDDTGWRVKGEGAFLMAFETPDATVYQIRSQHRHEEVEELIPSDYKGVMGCDRGPSYDAMPGVKQQKCLAHVDRSLVAVIEEDPGNRFAVTLKERLDAAQALWERHRVGAIDRETYDREGAALYGQVSVLFAKETVRQHFQRTRAVRTARGTLNPVKARSPAEALRAKTNRRLVEEIGSHHERGNLLRFLSDPSIEPTNNRAERALRPAVIARKVSHCSKNERGAMAYAAFVSVIRTATQHGKAALDTLFHLFTHPATSPDATSSPANQ